eukprot:TRINITY_DN65483_c0_g1_i1.p1 TRINITY_DN65483_c0_g1~~TRINITY_DN65483_c0_g1_i1.p1  ORF type:complete len:123 (+),score=33.11 TRINITY_DN65483_c0_g1_i1:28-369(+)
MSQSASADTDEVEATLEPDDDEDITKVKRKLEFSRIEEEDLLSSEGQTDEVASSFNQSQCSANMSATLSQLQSIQGNEDEPSSDEMVQITPASEDNGNYDQVSGMFSDASSLE